MVSRFVVNRKSLEAFIQNKAVKKTLPSNVIDFIFDSADENWEELNLLKEFFASFAKVIIRSQADSMTMSEAVHLIDVLEKDLDSFLSSFFYPLSTEIATIK